MPGAGTWPQTSAFYPHKNRLSRDSGQLQDGLPLQVALHSVFNCSVFNCSVFNCTDSVQLRWLIVMGVYHVFQGFYCLNGAQLLPAAMHGPWVDVPKTMGNCTNSLIQYPGCMAA